MRNQSDSSEEESLSGSLHTLMTDSLEILFSIARLAKLELSIAQKSLLYIIVLGVLSMGWFFCFWLLGSGLLIIALHHSLDWTYAAMIVCGFQLVLLLICLVMIIRYKKNLSLPATMRQLTPQQEVSSK